MDMLRVSDQTCHGERCSQLRCGMLWDVADPLPGSSGASTGRLKGFLTAPACRDRALTITRTGTDTAQASAKARVPSRGHGPQQRQSKQGPGAGGAGVENKILVGCFGKAVPGTSPAPLAEKEQLLLLPGTRSSSRKGPGRGAGWHGTSSLRLLWHLQQLEQHFLVWGVLTTVKFVADSMAVRHTLP